MINTKNTNKIPIRFELEMELILTTIIDELEKAIDNIAEGPWILTKDKKYYFIPEDDLIIPNTKEVKLISDGWIHESKEYKRQWEFLPWKQFNDDYARKWFHTDVWDRGSRLENNPLVSNGEVFFTDMEGKEFYANCMMTAQRYIYLPGGYGNEDSDVDIYLPMYKLSAEERLNRIIFLAQYNWNIFSDKNLSEKFEFISKLFSEGWITSDVNEIKFKGEGQYPILEQLLQKYEAIWKEGKKAILPILQKFDDSALTEIKEQLLSCDKLRINMEAYPEHILHDLESGHWELWEEGNRETKVTSETTLVARNPVYDAMKNKSGVIGIDFGTKSTVVTYKQSRADVLPMRIGSGQYARSVTKDDFENPTVMELRNVKKFMGAYKQYEGRPETRWEDLLISHEAAEQLKSEQNEGEAFASFFNELKQWASDKSRKVKLRDLQGTILNIPAYLNLSEEDFDPIEIYAYYLGLFINNMIHGVYLRYKLSFPATAEKQVRDKILDSFTRGIKKSLPVQVLKDEACMRIFKVEQGASEPAAYAITALEGYGFEPEEEEKFYYGIFDFGGGTMDYDFGVWKSEEEEPENYDYQISHFGEGGDPYLGGENILKILAYKVFIDNYDNLLQEKIVFIRPSGEKEVVGKDYLICQESQYAQFNHRRLMERLRGVWEGDEEVREQFRSGSIALPLFTMEGETKNNYVLEVNLNELDQLIEERIEEGVVQFFDALKNCFGVQKNQEDIHDVDDIHIFLAGNSCKSPVVYTAFKKYIDIYKAGLNGENNKEKEWFHLYPPLGTAISDQILNGTIKPHIDELIAYINKETEVESYEQSEELNRPTGKTGVAYGLLNNRVRVLQNESKEIGFRYYIGQNRRKKFYCVIDKDNQEYQQWVRFCTASREEFEIWFTRSATAPSNKMPINQLGVYSEIGFITDPTLEKYVYIRLVSPTEIEYMVASEEEIESSSYDEDKIERILLQEE